MDKFKCDKDCDNCDLFARLSDTLKKAHDNKQPVMILAQLTDDVATAFVDGSHDSVVKMIYTAMESDERIEDIFMHVMSIKSQAMLKKAIGSDAMSEIMEDILKRVHSTDTPKPKAEC